MSGNILLVGFPETSYVTGMRKIARVLCARGHRVLFMTTDERISSFIGLHGFETRLLDDPYSKKWTMVVPGVSSSTTGPAATAGPTAPMAPPTAASNLFGKIHAKGARRNWVARASFEHRRNGMLEIMRQDRIDLVILEPAAWTYAIPPLQAGIKVLHLSNGLDQPANSFNPPSFYGRIPGSSWASRAQVVGDWHRLKFYRWRTDLRRRVFAGQRSLKCVLRAEIRQTGVPLIHGTYGPRFALPQIVPLPPEFDFSVPSNGAASFRYMSSTADLDRPEFASFDLASLDPQRKLVICSLGTFRYPWMEGFFPEFIRAMKRMPHRQAVINVGPTIDPGCLPKAENVIVARGIPQLALLKHANLMVTHAGPNTVRECAALAVPMLCLPGWLDQFGTAARVVYHGLGLRADGGRVRAENLVRLLETIDGESYRRNLKRFQRHFTDEKSFPDGIQFIERY